MTDWTRWKEIINDKPQDTPYAIAEGRLLGVPKEELQRVARGVIEQCVKDEWYGLAFAIMKAAEIGSEEERRVMGERTYNQKMGTKRLDHIAGAVHLAKELWGENSPQYLAAKDKEEKINSRKEQKTGKPIFLFSRKATFVNFRNAFQKLGERGINVDVELEADMRHLLGSEITEQIMDFLNSGVGALGNKKLLDFFREHDCSEEELAKMDINIGFKK